MDKAKIKEWGLKIVKWLAIAIVALSALKEWLEKAIPVLDKLPL